MRLYDSVTYLSTGGIRQVEVLSHCYLITSIQDILDKLNYLPQGCGVMCDKRGIRQGEVLSQCYLPKYRRY